MLQYPPILFSSAVSGKTYIIHGNPRVWTEVPAGSKLEDFPEHAVKLKEVVIPVTLRREHKVQSSKPGQFYTVTQDGNYYNCTCTGFLYRNKCKHVEQVKNEQV